jgi:hypothetical protein
MEITAENKFGFDADSSWPPADIASGAFSFGSIWRDTRSRLTWGNGDSNQWRPLELKASDGWTGSTSSNGSHSHTVTVNSNGEHNHGITVQSAGAHTHGVTVNSAGAHTHTFTTGNNSGVNAIYGASSTVQPPAMIGMLIIKY